MSSSDQDAWPTKPVSQILGYETFVAVQQLAKADATIINRGSLGLHGSSSDITRLTESRQLSDDQLIRLRTVLLSPASYWIGHPIYKRLPPLPDFLFECTAGTTAVFVAVDLKNPGWRIDCCGESYWAFMFAEHIIRAIAKEVFPEFASPRKNSVWAKGALPNKPFHRR